MLLEWRTLVAKEKEKQLVALIKEENLKDAETRHFIDYAFRDGVVKTTGTDIDNLMPPIWVYPEFCVNVLRECKQQKLV